MADKKQPTEKTPKGLEIPIPSRSEFYKNLRKTAKTAKPPKRSTPDSPKK